MTAPARAGHPTRHPIGHPIGHPTGHPATGRAFQPLWAASVLLPLIAFGIGAQFTWQGVQAEARSRVARSLDMLHEHALRAFETQEAVLEASDARISGLDWPAIAGSPELHRFFVQLQRRAPSTAGMGLVDPAGRMVLISAEDLFPIPPIDVSDRDYVRAHRDGVGGTFIGEVVRSRPSGTPIFAFSRPRTGPDGSPDGGVLASSFLPSVFERFYAGIAESPADAIALIRLDGAVLARHPMLPDEPWRIPAADPALAALRQGQAMQGDSWIRSAIHGQDRRLTFRRVGAYPVAVGYGLDPGVTRAAWMERLRVLAAICAATALLLLALTWLAMRATRSAAGALRQAALEAELARAEAERRMEAEARLRGAEQAAALGLVAAGVAHDMNNLVQSVVAAGRLLDRRATDVAEVRRLARLVSDAAQRGERLARRMLEFGRPEPQREERFDLSRSLSGLGELVGGLLGSGIRLRCDVAASLPPALADRREFETVLVNLLVNARDAMPQGGEVRVTARPEMAEASGMPLPRPGPYLRIEVADTGEGMPAEVLRRVGEPFFTTKGPGKGSGLGLMMARHFAERAGGALAIASQPGLGTAVTLWLPAAD